MKPRWPSILLSARSLRPYEKIGDCEQSTAESVAIFLMRKRARRALFYLRSFPFKRLSATFDLHATQLDSVLHS